MKTWSKYIILIITIFAIFLCKGESISSKENHIALIEQLADETEFISTDLSDLPYSQSTTFKNTHQSQKNSLRRDNTLGTRCQILPNLLRNERHKRMYKAHQQIEVVASSLHSSLVGGLLICRLYNLQVPTAEVVPEEFVDAQSGPEGSSIKQVLYVH